MEQGARSRNRPNRLPSGKLVVDWLVYLVVRIVMCVVQATRIETCDAAARRLAWLAYDVARIRRQITDENLQHAFPEKTETDRMAIARGMWHHLILMVCEIAHLHRKIHETNWMDYVSCPEAPRQVDLFLSPRPKVVISAHFGNFEVGGVLVGLLGFPTHTIARPFDNRFLDRYMTRHRSSKGQFILPKTGSAQLADKVLGEGGTLVLLGDQHAGDSGCWVDFFHRPASCHKAIALFSLAHQAPLVLTYSRRLGRPMQFEVGLAGVFDPLEHPTANVKQITVWYNQQLEELIRRYPEQYWWLHRRWKKRPAKMVRGKRPQHSGLESSNSEKSRGVPADVVGPAACGEAA